MTTAKNTVTRFFRDDSKSWCGFATYEEAVQKKAELVNEHKTARVRIVLRQGRLLDVFDVLVKMPREVTVETPKAVAPETP